MLEHLRKLHANWREDCLIGDIIIQHRDELIKAYPPYVNFFEQMKEQLQYCDREYPRFHAFLKINQTKPECGRQGLQDLMIRPVQRLPSISLLLNDILKHTSSGNADHGRLEEALKAIKQVTLHINEDKRRTESRMAIFDIFNDIDGCPAHLVSSNRSFILKCEVNELSDSLSGRGDSLVLYLFSDSIELTEWLCQRDGLSVWRRKCITYKIAYILKLTLDYFHYYCSIWTALRIRRIQIVGTRYPLALTSGNASVSRSASHWRAHPWALESDAPPSRMPVTCLSTVPPVRINWSRKSCCMPSRKRVMPHQPRNRCDLTTSWTSIPQSPTMWAYWILY